MGEYSKGYRAFPITISSSATFAIPPAFDYFAVFLWSLSGALERHESLVRAGGVHKYVDLVEEADPAINDRIDAAYRAKYRNQPAQYVDPMVTAEARAATIRLEPRG